MMLRWPLDITTCQNDKLLYIATPSFKGMKDPLRERITLVPKKLQAIPIDRIGGLHINALKALQNIAFDDETGGALEAFVLGHGG